MTGVEDPRARAVEAFGQAWRAPSDADALVGRVRPHLRADHRFRQPLTRGTGRDLAQFRRRIVPPLLGALADANGTVELWPPHGGAAFIEMARNGCVGRRGVRLRACDEVTLTDGLALDRQTRVPPLPLIAAVLRIPRLRVSMLRWQPSRTAARGTT